MNIRKVRVAEWRYQYLAHLRYPRVYISPYNGTGSVYLAYL
ncbi:hypothetical protein D805_0403 [Bifidobacterium thermophilum RBL67]|uniref:Uncharacterized protein n=1 Tax=Bifidobacterium thermophilum RBL67 TaxID=1254439 RepID=M4RB55_9BIFI|nr:hypothetical protein D805_0403 [Bifidobacterium thermophilum RBL67]